ncbi:hypothetical protein L1049_007942 [Liquidambar formosana]|uniref:THO1-MOS11 C-terminal domain-containing protein n=1 Tax=Liquidambar formosana TaxID=63359 RepID=A0AAP0S5M9_LIQFO
MATETQKLTKDQCEENPKKTLETPDPSTKTALANHLEELFDISDPQPQSPTETPDADGSVKDGDESKGGDASSADAAVGSPSATSAPVSDTQKKMRRAERFGMPVQLSEEEKRNSRAERFGTGSTLHGSDALTKSEELKRKARAERFGIPAQSVGDGEAKKKARLARFAPVAKADGVEEDKRKARALRRQLLQARPLEGPEQKLLFLTLTVLDHLILAVLDYNSYKKWSASVVDEPMVNLKFY